MAIIPPSRHFEGSEFTSEFTDTWGSDVPQIVESLFGPITWVSDTEGFCGCPGEHLHTSHNSTKDCKVYIATVPTLVCFHSSCRTEVEEACKRLRQLARGLPGHEWTTKPLTPEAKAQMARVRARENLRRQTAASRDRLLRDYAWPYAQILSDSDVIRVPESEHWRLALDLFTKDEVIWIGSIHDSGRPLHSSHFRTREEWQQCKAAPGQFTCASTFKPSSFSRGNDNVSRRASLVVESDELDRDTVGAVFRWMRDKLTLNLRCIVDTAGKSLHGWFVFPAQDVLDELRVVLPELGCDPKMFTASQPCRLPGAQRDGRFQKIIYLKGGQQ